MDALLADIRTRALRALMPRPQLRLSEWIEANIKTLLPYCRQMFQMPDE